MYTAAGLEQSLPSVDEVVATAGSSGGEQEEEEVAPAVHTPSAKKAAALVGFAVHVLTGWQPSGPMDLKAVVSSDIARANTLIQEMLYRGVLSVDAAMVPGEVPTCEILNLVDRNSGGILKTKQQFREEFRALATSRQAAIEALDLREIMCGAISSYLEKSCFRECYSICFNDGSGLRSLPVLALSSSTDAEKLSDFDRLSNIRLLVHWRVVQSAQQKKRLSKAPTLNSELSQHLEGLDQPLPPATDVDCKWLSLGDLMALGAYVIAVDTMVSLPKQQSLGWHWTGSSADAAAVDSKAAKGKKDAKAAADPAAGVGECKDPGEMPTCFVSIDTTAFFAEHAAEPGAEEREAVAEQERALGDEEGCAGGSPTDARRSPVASHLSVSIFVHADVVRSCAPLAMPSGTGNIYSPYLVLLAGKSVTYC